MTIKEAEDLISQLRRNHEKLNHTQQEMFAVMFGPIHTIELKVVHHANHKCILWHKANVMKVTSSIVAWPKIIKS